MNIGFRYLFNVFLWLWLIVLFVLVADCLSVGDCCIVFAYVVLCLLCIVGDCIVCCYLCCLFGLIWGLVFALICDFGCCLLSFCCEFSMRCLWCICGWICCLDLSFYVGFVVLG